MTALGGVGVTPRTGHGIARWHDRTIDLGEPPAPETVDPGDELAAFERARERGAGGPLTRPSSRARSPSRRSSRSETRYRITKPGVTAFQAYLQELSGFVEEHETSHQSNRKKS